MKKIFIVLFVLYCHVYGTAQNSMNVVQLPELTREYQKYLGYPVSIATGIPDINIPLFDLKVNEYTMPFSLRYHSSGIKVNQEPGMFGYGWTLMPTFRISRTIINQPDEIYLLNKNELYGEDELFFQNRTGRSPKEDVCYLEDIAKYNSMTPNDSSYDIFTVHLPGQSCSFIMEKENYINYKVVKIQASLLEITPRIIQNRIQGFDVVDENGVLYKFGYYVNENTEHEYIESVIGNVPETRTGWMLYKAIMPGDKEEINFRYVRKQITTQIQYSKDIISDNLRHNVQDDGLMYPEGRLIDVQLRKYGIDDLKYNWKQTSTGGHTHEINISCLPLSITAPNCKIDFEYKNSSAYAIWDVNRIKVTNNGETIKTIDFTRLSTDEKLLSSLKISTEGTYGFIYNPKKFDYKYGWDYWGYYNGANNSTLEPRTQIQIPTYSGIRTITVGKANREPYEIHMKANILEKITYPTGGYTEFDYEANKYLSGNVEKTVGGLRVRGIKTYDPVANKEINKTYKYGNNEQGYGNPIYVPKPEDYITEKNQFQHSPSGIVFPNYKYGSIIYRIRETNTSSAVESYLSQNTPIWYNQVVEYSDGGKTVYKFDYTPDFLNDLNGTPFVSDYNCYINSQPELINKTVYKIENNIPVPLKEVQNIYNTYEQGSIRGLIVKYNMYAPTGHNEPEYHTWRNFLQSWPHPYYEGIFVEAEVLPENLFAYSDYTINRGLRQLTKTIETDFTALGNVSKTTLFTYDVNHPYNLRELKESTSENTNVTTLFYYPYDNVGGNITGEIRNLLLNNKRYNYVLQKEVNNNNSIKTQQTTYKSWGSRTIKPLAVYENNIKKMEYKYNSVGRMIQYVGRDEIPVSIIWGYNYQYPVAEVINADFQACKAALGVSATTDDLDYLQSLTSATLANQTARLRNILSAEASTYLYKPYVGITNVANHLGYQTTYYYDNLKRLESVKDHNGKVIKKFSYNLKNQ